MSCRFLVALALSAALWCSPLAAQQGVPIGPSGGAGGTTLTPGQLPGTATNDSASAGNVGQYIESNIAAPGSGITTAVSANVTSISLTAGDWDVSAQAGYSGSGTTTVGTTVASISLVSATLDQTVGRAYSNYYNNATVYANTNLQNTMGPVRLSLASTTTVFLVCNSTFGVATTSCFGILHARRVR